jgi:hypothetical protein
MLNHRIISTKCALDNAPCEGQGTDADCQECTRKQKVQRQQVKLIVRVLKMTWTEKTDIVKDLESNRWWLTGCKEGDQPLPQGDSCETISEAIDCTLAWLAPEIYERAVRNGMPPSGRHG